MQGVRGSSPLASTRLNTLESQDSRVFFAFSKTKRTSTQMSFCWIKTTLQINFLPNAFSLWGRGSYHGQQHTLDRLPLLPETGAAVLLWICCFRWWSAGRQDKPGEIRIGIPRPVLGAIHKREKAIGYFFEAQVFLNARGTALCVPGGVQRTAQILTGAK